MNLEHQISIQDDYVIIRNVDQTLPSKMILKRNLVSELREIC